MQLKEIFRNNVHAARRAREWSQEYMAQQLGISHITYQKIESGKTTPNLDRVQQIAEVLEVTIAYLLGIGEYAAKILKP